MLAIPVFVNAGTAVSYFTESKDNYYQKEGDIGRWQGKLTETFNLPKEITKEDLEHALWGRNPQTGEQLVEARTNEKGDRIRAGLDLTFSAPKSVSIMLEVAKSEKDETIINTLMNAHDSAVAKVLERAEERYSQARTTKDGVTQREDSGNLLIAKFTHDISRPVEKDGKPVVDPQLHTHAIVMNMTQTKDGQFHAIESKEIFQNFMSMGMEYRTELASALKEAGIEIRVTDANKGFFELKHINDEIIQNYSSRAGQIVNAIEGLKEQYPHKTETELKQMAAHKTREWKGEINREEIRENNMQRLTEAGYTKEQVLNYEKAKQLTPQEQQEKTEVAIKNAVTAITEQKAVFTREDVITAASKFTLNSGISLEVLDAAFDNQMKAKDSQKLFQVDKDNFTTKEFIKADKQIIKETINGRNSVENVVSKKEAKELLDGYNERLKEESLSGRGLTKGQYNAAEMMISSKDMIVGIQGDAGTGKTTMLKAVNELVGDKTNLIGISYTGKAAKEIELKTQAKSETMFAESGIKSSTIASFMANLENKGIESIQNSKIIVDEASMLGTRDALKLVEIAKQSGSQLVLMGDMKQFNSIQAGSPFAMLQESGAMQTAKMNEVLRQKDETLKEAVMKLNNYDSKGALSTLDRAGKVHELGEKDENGNIDRDSFRDASLKKVKEHYFDKKDTQAVVAARDTYDTLIVTNTNEMKDAINSMIRGEMKEQGLIGEKDFNFNVRESTRLSPSEKFFAQNYKEGHFVFFQKSTDSLKAGTEAQIVHRDEEKNNITVETGGKLHEIDLTKDAMALQSYEEKEKNFSIGEKIVFEKNDKQLGVKNGETGVIKQLDENGNVTIEKGEGKDKEIVNFNVSTYGYFNHGYAVTMHKSQGQTNENVIAVMESQAQNYNSFYVGVTRAENDIQIITDDKERLEKSIFKEQEKENAADSLTYSNIAELIQSGQEGAKAYAAELLEEAKELLNEKEVDKLENMLEKEDKEKEFPEPESEAKEEKDKFIEELEFMLDESEKEHEGQEREGELENEEDKEEEIIKEEEYERE